MHIPQIKSYAKYAMFCLPLAIVACDEDDTVTPPVVVDNSPSVVLGTNDNFEDLAAALTSADLLGALDDQTALTVFAPNDAAFGAVDLSGISSDDLRATLLYHTLLGLTVEAGDIADGLTIVRDAANTSPSLIINNDGGVDVNDANVVTTDIMLDNGVAHEIDKVLMMPTVVNLAQYVPTLSSLVDAVVATELVETLSTTQDITVFAPTNTAFEQTPTGDLTTEQVADILKYHVVPSVAFSTDLSDGMMVPTLQGDMLTINAASTSPSGFTVTGSNGISRNIVTVDVRGTNGVVHLIDGVLLSSN